MPKGSRTSTAVEDAVVRIIDTYERGIAKLTAEIENAMEHKARVDAALITLTPDEQRFIELKYYSEQG